MEDHYDPPEGFVFDPQSRQYYRDDGYGTDPASGADVLRLTWFDPQSGEYRQTVYPAGQVDSVTHMDEQPAQRRAVSSASLKPFVPKPLTNRSVHPDVHGTGYVGVLAFAAWLAAVIGPIAALVRVSGDVRALVDGWTNGTLGDIAGQIMNFDAFDLSSLSSIWDLILELPGSAVSLALGALLLLFALIPLLFMAAALRANVRAARVLVIVNLCLIMLGEWLCYSAIAQVDKLLNSLPQPYGGAAQIILIAMCVSGVLLVIAAVVYFMMAARGIRLHEDIPVAQ